MTSYYERFPYYEVYTVYFSDIFCILFLSQYI